MLLVVATSAVTGYLAYRVNRFTTSAFRSDAAPPQTAYGASTPTLASAATATVMPTTGSSAPPQATAPAATTPTSTPLPYGNSAVISRLQNGERVTVLLLGFGGPGHDGGYLTDSIQVMSFDPTTNTATLISVPRDLWVYIPPFEGRGGYWGKINEAYEVGMGPVDPNSTNLPYGVHERGGMLASQVVARVLGIPIDYWASLDFVGFRQFIDALGGVDVFVERAFTDPRYPNNDNPAIDPTYRTIHFDCGPQHMNGERAIEFARSRHSPEDGSDFSRSRRQQLLMTAVKDKLFRVETIPKVFSLLNSIEGHFHTSFSFNEVKDLAGWVQEQARAKQRITVQSAVIETGSLLYATTSSGGAYILLPRQGQGEYGAIQRYVRDMLAGRISATPGTPIPSETGTATPAPATPGTAEPIPSASATPCGR